MNQTRNNKTQPVLVDNLLCDEWESDIHGAEHLVERTVLAPYVDRQRKLGHRLHLGQRTHQTLRETML